MRPIDADAILKHSFDGYYREGDFDVFATFVPALVIENAPTVEAKPVVHAHWENEHLNRYGHLCHCCSNCGFSASHKDKNWCANCGAQMDKFASDNNVGSKGVKIPVISMEDVPKLAKEMEK